MTAEEAQELKVFCRDVREVQQGGEAFLYLEGLRLSLNSQLLEVDALLCLHMREGYMTRLYLSIRIENRGANWSTAYLLDRQWHTWSWQGVSVQQRPAQVLAAHLRAIQ